MGILRAMQTVRGGMDDKKKQQSMVLIEDWLPLDKLKVEGHLCDNGNIFRAKGTGSSSAPIDARSVFRQAGIEKAITGIAEKLNVDCAALLRDGDAAEKKASRA